MYLNLMSAQKNAIAKGLEMSGMVKTGGYLHMTGKWSFMMQYVIFVLVNVGYVFLMYLRMVLVSDDLSLEVQWFTYLSCTNVHSTNLN